MCSISLVSTRHKIRACGFRSPCKSRLSPSHGLLNGSALVSTIHKLALHLTEMQVLIHQPGQSLRFPGPQCGGCVSLFYIFHVASSARASCLLCLRDAQAATGLTSVALFSVSGPGKVPLLCSVDALFLQACWAPSAASRFWGHAVTVPHSGLNGFLQELLHSLVPTANHQTTCLCRTDGALKREEGKTT